jgi:hypothetical protein
MMTERQFKEFEVRIARYRLLQREVTDPLAQCLLRSIVVELEADLRAERNRSLMAPSLAPCDLARRADGC